MEAAQCHWATCSLLTILIEKCFSPYQAKASFTSLHHCKWSLAPFSWEPPCMYQYQKAAIRAHQCLLPALALPCCCLLCSQDTELSSVPPEEWQCHDHPSAVWGVVYFFQFEPFYSVNYMTAGTQNTGEGHLPSVVYWNLWPLKDCIWSQKVVH